MTRWTDSEQEYLDEIKKLAEMKRVFSENFVRYRNVRPTKIGGKVLYMTDEQANQMAFMVNGVELEVQGAIVDLLARRLDRNERF